jgi:tetratricopeptide (TPR) repeat protein
MKITKLSFIPTMVFTMALGFLQLSGQTLQDGLNFMAINQFDQAAPILQKFSGSSPMAAFQYAEALTGMGKLDESMAIFQKNITANPKDALAAAGLAKIMLLKKNPSEAKKYSDLAIKLGRKDKTFNIFTLLGMANLQSGNLAAVQPFVDMALKKGAKEPMVHLLQGDLFAAQGNSSKAVEAYNNAAYFDPKNPIANFKIGQIYRKAKNNRELGIAALEKSVKIDPSFSPAFLQLGESYFLQNDYKKAKEFYSKYMEVSGATADLDTKEQYAFLLYMNRDFDQSIKVANEIVAKDPKRQYALRYVGYSLIEQNKFKEGLEYMEPFMAKLPEEKAIAQDYENFGRALSENGKDSLAILNYKKAMAKDPAKSYLYDAISRSYEKQKRFNDAALALETKMGNTGSAEDYTNLARIYFAGRNFPKAAQAYDGYIAKVPTVTFGYLWKARSLKRLDPDLDAQPELLSEFGKAKDAYAAMIPVGEKDVEKNKKELIEAYNYIASYHFLKEEKDQSKSLLSKVLALDPTNSNATQLMQAMAQ